MYYQKQVMQAKLYHPLEVRSSREQALPWELHAYRQLFLLLDLVLPRNPTMPQRPNALVVHVASWPILAFGCGFLLFEVHRHHGCAP